MYRDIIDFWFEEIDKSQWWKKDNLFDDRIRENFTNIYHRASRCELFSWRENSLGRLAEVIVLDQFSRNMFRGKPEAFACDPLALSLAQTAVAAGEDADLSAEQKSFLYMPYMHSESLVVHQEAIKLFSKLGIESTLNFEIRHKNIIERFGRYPHRNAILGRISTKDELEFLRTPGSGF